MGKELRRHPRIPTSWSCTLKSEDVGGRVEATTFSVASHGLGVKVVDSESGALAVGSTVAVSIPLGNDVTEVEGTIAWIRRSPLSGCTLGIALTGSSNVAPTTYREWVEERYFSLREESFALGGSLVEDRLIPLRTLLKALDSQSRDGGYLCDHLPGLERVKVTN